MMVASWGHLLGGPAIAPANSAGYALENSEYLEQIDILAREPFQNSKDERIGKLFYKLKMHKFTGAKKANFVRLLDLNEVSRLSPLFKDDQNYFEDGFKVLKTLDAPDIPIYILEIFDNAVGLGGEWNLDHSNSNFYKLVLSLYDSGKVNEDRDSLGSYGVGKMVFALSSKLRMMLYYSHFRQDNSFADTWARFMGTAFFNKFMDGGKSYSGHSYFGSLTDFENHVRAPLQNEDAVKFVKDLGLPVREKTVYGTSVFVPFVIHEDIFALKEAFEKWWWPIGVDSEFEQNFEISFEDENGRIEYFNPSQTSYLRPFISAYKNYLMKAETSEGKLDTIRAKMDSKFVNAGDMSLLLDNRSDDTLFTNSLAQIRSGMVVKYEKVFREEDPPCIGTFVVADEKNVNRIFKMSEPPAHDNWNPNEGRLKRTSGVEAGEFLKRAFSQIENKANSFKLSKKELKRPKKQRALAFMDNLLMPLLRTDNSGTSLKIEQMPRAPIIRKSGKRIKNDLQCYDELSFQLMLDDNFEFESADFNLRIELQAAEGTQGNKMGQKIKIKSVVDGVTKTLDDTSEMLVTLTKGKMISGTSTGYVNPEWVTRWKVSIEPIKEQF